MTTAVRTVSPSAWAEASQRESVKPGTVSEAANKCMAELDQQRPGVGRSGYSPWLNTGGQCYGAMWPGVPGAREWWKDSEGAWMVSTHAIRPAFGFHYIRLCSALPDAEVQYGFCPIRLDRAEEIAQKYLGEEWEQPSIRSMFVGNYLSAYFRVDKMVIAATRLGGRKNVSDAGKRFKILLGRMGLSVFVEDMLRGLFLDSHRNILVERDDRYREMVQLVAESAYPGFLKPPSMAGDNLPRFRRVLQLEGSDDWEPSVLYPRLYNVLMPVPIFEEVDKNLELGIPPIVPQYAASDYWMFNGSWSDPCTGLTTSRRGVASMTGSKIVGGIVNRFNCDIPGEVSYWPFDRNPPVEWVNSFVGQLQKLREQQLPASTLDRTDLSLLYARGIPVVMDIRHGDEPRVLRYSKLVGLNENDRGEVTHITTRECNASGELWIDPPDPGSANLPHTDESEEDVGYVCGDCGIGLLNDEVYSCNVCGRDLCKECEYFCESCGSGSCETHLRDHNGCVQCAICTHAVPVDERLCGDCEGGPFCPTCREEHECPT